MRPVLYSLVFAAALAIPSAAQAEASCTLVMSYPEMKTLHEDGDCDTRHSPASTFKIPLAVMGYDSGFLKDENHPVIPYKDDYQGYDDQKITADPKIWQDKSIVWYSQLFAKWIGTARFKTYVDQFDYGNKDVTGMPGNLDGLTHAWLGTSLAISPKEQVAFIGKLLGGKLGVSERSYALTRSIVPVFKAGEWTVHGKTGSVWPRNADGAYDKTKPLGWFVGWAENGDETIVFARMIQRDEAMAEPGGFRARSELLAALPALMTDEPPLPAAAMPTEPASQQATEPKTETEESTPETPADPAMPETPAAQP